MVHELVLRIRYTLLAVSIALVISSVLHDDVLKLIVLPALRSDAPLITTKLVEPVRAQLVACFATSLWAAGPLALYHSWCYTISAVGDERRLGTTKSWCRALALAIVSGYWAAGTLDLVTGTLAASAPTGLRLHTHLSLSTYIEFLVCSCTVASILGGGLSVKARRPGALARLRRPVGAGLAIFAGIAAVDLGVELLIFISAGSVFEGALLLAYIGRSDVGAR